MLRHLISPRGLIAFRHLIRWRRLPALRNPIGLLRLRAFRRRTGLARHGTVLGTNGVSQRRRPERVVYFSNVVDTRRWLRRLV
ncbi:hypothetical protein [Kribbella sp. NPDC055071]